MSGCSRKIALCKTFVLNCGEILAAKCLCVDAVQGCELHSLARLQPAASAGFAFSCVLTERGMDGVRFMCAVAETCDHNSPMFR